MISFFKYKNLPILLLFLVGVFYIYKAIFFLPHDFANYYYGAFFLENGTFNTQIYDPTWFNLEITKHSKNVFAAYAPNTPFLSLFFLPFTFFSFETSKIIFNSVSLFLFVFSIFRIFKFYAIDTKYIILILLLFFVPIKNNLLFGQVYFLLFFFISEGFLAYKNKKWLFMATFWSLAILLKVFPVLLFLFLILEKKWKALAYLLVLLTSLFLSSIFINGFNTWLFYFQEILPKASKGEISGEFIKNYQSFLMFFKHMFIQNKDSIYGLFNFKAAIISSKLIVISFGVFYTKNNKSTLKKFSYWIAAFYLLSPYSSSYGSLLLIIPLLLIFKNNSWKSITFYSFLIFLYTNVPYNLFQSPNCILNFFKLFALVVLFYSLFIYKTMILKTQFAIIGISILFGYSFSFFNQLKTQEKSIPLFPKNNIAFIIDYAVKHNRLNYVHWSKNGLINKQTNYKVSSINKNNVTIIKNEIYINNQLKKLPKSNKKNAAIINDNILVYLSDLGRGYGFYKLITVKL